MECCASRFLIKETSFLNETNHRVISSLIFIRRLHIASFWLHGLIKCNKAASRRRFFLYMCCLSTADPNYLNVTLILGIQGIVQLNQGQPEVNDGQNHLGASPSSFKSLSLMWPQCNYSVQTKLLGFFFNQNNLFSFLFSFVVFFLSFKFGVNVAYRIFHRIDSFEGWAPSGTQVKAGLLFIPFNRSQASVPPVRRRLINTGSGGHLHVLHENVGPSAFSTQAQQRGD